MVKKPAQISPVALLENPRHRPAAEFGVQTSPGAGFYLKNQPFPQLGQYLIQRSLSVRVGQQLAWR